MSKLNSLSATDNFAILGKTDKKAWLPVTVKSESEDTFIAIPEELDLWWWMRTNGRRSAHYVLWMVHTRQKLVTDGCMYTRGRCNRQHCCLHSIALNTKHVIAL